MNDAQHRTVAQLHGARIGRPCSASDVHDDGRDVYLGAHYVGRLGACGAILYDRSAPRVLVFPDGTARYALTGR